MCCRSVLPPLLARLKDDVSNSKPVCHAASLLHHGLHSSHACSALLTGCQHNYWRGWGSRAWLAGAGGVAGVNTGPASAYKGLDFPCAHRFGGVLAVGVGIACAGGQACRQQGTRRKGLSLEVSAITLHWQSGKAVWQIDTAKALVLACSTLATPRQHAAACTAPSTEHSTVVCQLVLTCSRPNAINGRSSAHAVHQTL